MNNFEWQTEEDTPWDDEDPIIVTAAPEDYRRRRLWLSVVAIFLGLGLLGWWLAHQSATRIEIATGTAHEEILTSHALLHDAAETLDDELLFHMLSGRDMVWTTAQQSLFTQQLLWNRPSMGISLHKSEPLSIDVNLAPDLLSAEVTTSYHYATTNLSPVTETLTLHQTALYRRGEERWLMAPPDTAFWGHNTTITTTYVTLKTPNRDRELAIRLATDLSRLIEDSCRFLDHIPCPHDLRVNVILDTNPYTLIWITDPNVIDRSGLNLRLPAITLAGTPVNEAGYKALSRGYARLVFRAVSRHLLADRCCDEDIFFDLWLQDQLATIGFAPFQEPAPTSLPDQDIQLFCPVDSMDDFSNDTTVINLFRYRIDQGEWEAELRGREFLSMLAAPDDEGVLLTELLDFQWGGIWWHNQTPIRLLGNRRLTDDPHFNWTNAPSNRLIWAEAENTSLMTDSPLGYLLDLDNCSSSGCNTTPVELYTPYTWSPDGRFLIGTRGSELWLAETDGKLPQIAGRGVSPFWLDGNRFGYINANLEGETQVVLKHTANVQAESVLVTSADLKQHLPVRFQADPLSIGLIHLDDNNPEQLLIFAYTRYLNGRPTRAYLFRYKPDSDELSLIIQSENMYSFMMSEGNRWVGATIFNTDQQQWEVRLQTESQPQPLSFAPHQGERSQPPHQDWSADGRWLLHLEGGILYLFAPDTGVGHTLVPLYPRCTQAYWINRDGN